MKESVRLATVAALLLSGQLATAATQSISFPQVPNQTLGSAPVPVTAKASSGLPVSFESTTPSVCKTAGNLVMLLSAGPCFVTAHQSGSGLHDAASASQGFDVVAPKPSGTLHLGQSFGSSHTLSLVEADFNKDGIKDIASASHEGAVTILLGDGAGGFRPSGDPIVFGTSVQALATGDFDGDGNPDLAIATGANQVAVFLGNGAGGFAAAPGSPFAAGSGPRSIAIGDFNRDGIEDLAIADFAGGVTILRGNGTGGFAASQGSPFATGAGTSAVVAADLNGDGLIDLAAANSSDGTVTVLTGNQAGGFTAAPGGPVAVGMLPQSMVVADFNRDGIEDLATANRGSGTLTVLLGNGSGGFVAAPGSPFAAGLSLQSVAAGDLDGDGIVDLIASNNTEGIKVFVGDGTGGFRAPVAFGAPLNSVSAVVGDFSGDGISDVAAANYVSGGVTILSGALADTVAILHSASGGNLSPGDSLSLILDISNGTIAFGSPAGSVTFSDGTRALGASSENASPFLFTVPNLSAGTHHLTAHYSGDARSLPISATMTIQVGSTASAAKARSALSPQQVFPVPTLTSVTRNPAGVTTALDPDTQVVITGTNISAAGTKFQFSPPDGAQHHNSQSAFLSIIQQSAQFLATIPAAYLTTAGTAQVQLLNTNEYSNPPVSFTIAPAVQTMTIGGTTANYTAPARLYAGSPFVFPASSVSGQPIAYSVNAGSGSVCLSSGTLIVPLNYGTCTITASRSVTDSYSAASRTATFAINKPTASTSFTPSTLALAGTNPVAVTTGDFNGDSKTDIAVVNAGGTVTILLNNGSGSYTASQVTVGASPAAIVAADFNNDGKTDLAVANSGSGNVSILLGNGSGGFTASTVTVGTNPVALAIGDFNGDSAEDLVVANSVDPGSLSILTGNGAGGFTLTRTIGVGADPISVVVTDFDRDGNHDIAVVHSQSNELLVLLV